MIHVQYPLLRPRRGRRARLHRRVRLRAMFSVVVVVGSHPALARDDMGDDSPCTPTCPDARSLAAKAKAEKLLAASPFNVSQWLATNTSGTGCASVKGSEKCTYGTNHLASRSSCAQTA